MADYLSKRGANIAPSYATTGDLPASTQAGDLVFVGGQLGIAVNASTFDTCDKTDIVVYKFPGDSDAYSAGGYTGTGASLAGVTKWSMTSDSVDSSASHTLGAATSYVAGNVQSDTNGYVCGGITADGSNSTKFTKSQKFTFASTATSDGDTGISNGLANAGATNSSTKYYTFGSRGNNNTLYFDIYRGTFASEGTFADVGDMSGVSGNFGFTATCYGDTAGYIALNYNNAVHKFTFASEGNSSATSQTMASYQTTVGQSSETDGYYTGDDEIRKMSFASESNIIDQSGTLAVNAMNGGGCSSSSKGYHFGGNTSPYNQIQKFSFPGSSNATDIGDLVGTRNWGDYISGSHK